MENMLAALKDYVEQAQDASGIYAPEIVEIDESKRGTKDTTDHSRNNRRGRKGEEDDDSPDDFEMTMDRIMEILKNIDGGGKDTSVLPLVEDRPNVLVALQAFDQTVYDLLKENHVHYINAGPDVPEVHPGEVALCRLGVTPLSTIQALASSNDVNVVYLRYSPETLKQVLLARAKVDGEDKNTLPFKPTTIVDI